MSSRPLVVVTRGLPDGWLDPLPEVCDLLVGNPDPAGWQDAVRDALPRATGLFTLLTEHVDDAILDAAPGLEVVSNMAVGVDNIDLEACTARGIPVGNTPGVLTEATADLAFTLLLAAARRLPEATGDAVAGRWSTWSPTGWLGADLHGATLGVVGMGKIGRAVALRARGFGMRILFTNRSTVEPIEGAQQVEFDTLLQEADFISLHVPLNEQTHHLIDRQALSVMKSTAILVNTARGPIVDPEALDGALSQGEIRAAALDVTDPEPLPPTHPLFARPNCIIAPHIGSATAGTRRAMAQLAAQNLLAGLRGERLLHCANPAVYG